MRWLNWDIHKGENAFRTRHDDIELDELAQSGLQLVAETNEEGDHWTHAWPRLIHDERKEDPDDRCDLRDENDVHAEPARREPVGKGCPQRFIEHSIELNAKRVRLAVDLNRHYAGNTHAEEREHRWFQT